MAKEKEREAWTKTIDIYKDLAYLWDKKHNDYLNRDMRQEAFKMLLQVYNEKLCPVARKRKVTISRSPGLMDSRIRKLIEHYVHHHQHQQPINFPTAEAQAFLMDGIGRLGHDPPRGPSADWRVLTTADAAGTNGLTCLPKHGGARDNTFLVTHPMTDQCESPTPDSCREEMYKKLFKLESDTKLAASFSGVNHHKFLLGHMVVFRMHLNKSEDYIKKCDRVIASCGISCETTPRVRRWRRHAAEEIHRVRDDIQHTRRSYKDLVLHSHRHLNHLRKQANTNAREIIEKFIACSQ
ncbi:hypothetical protein evm_003646 [Chilo suppressalis]|nr:hypothetical protein evm_003646 [Chilo suppressalis]